VGEKCSNIGGGEYKKRTTKLEITKACTDHVPCTIQKSQAIKNDKL
jgi:hypothetical protein